MSGTSVARTTAHSARFVARALGYGRLSTSDDASSVPNATSARALVGCERADRDSADLSVKRPAHGVAAVAVGASLVVLVVCDLTIGGFQAWWDRHSLTASIVSSLLVLAVTALIVDEVVARRQRNDRAMSVAVQALIVYGQGRRTWNAVRSSSTGEKGKASGAGSSLEEWRALANMLLTASPVLFEDPEARQFLEEAERFSGLILSRIHKSDGTIGDDDLKHLETEYVKVEQAVRPLMTRLPKADESLFEALS